MQHTKEKWQSREGFWSLVKELVHYGSITGSDQEVQVAHYIADTLRTLPYFEQYPNDVRLHPTADSRLVVTALAQKEGATETVILLNHFDVVNIDDYGRWKHLAFQPDELTKQFYENKHLLPPDVVKDIESGEWLFGRGTMDMKCGIAVGMMMLERATQGAFDGNVLMLSVCDEEVNSAGMIAAVPILLQLAKEHDLSYTACINAEPMFARYPGDNAKYIYTGSLGKVLPGFFCCGKESHVGEPLAGLNANLMVSHVTCEMELNVDFCEQYGDEITHPPTSLQQYDLKAGYSVQTPHKAAALFNLFLMERPLEEVIALLLQTAKSAAANIEQTYRAQAARFAALQQSIPLDIHVEVLTFEELVSYAKERHGMEAIEHIERNVLQTRQAEEDERDIVIRFIHELTSLCNEKGPMIVVFFAPPYYPAVSSKRNMAVDNAVKDVINYASEQHDIDLKQLEYFTGLCDLSYIGPQASISSIDALTGNMPLWERVYELPLREIEQLQIPVINIGPVGKDAHKWTERLNVAYAEGPLPQLMHYTIEKLLTKRMN